MKNGILLVFLAVVLTASLVIFGGCAAPAPPAPTPAPAPAPTPAPLPKLSEYPTRSVELVIPYSAGGSLDMHARAMTAVGEQYLGKPLVPVLKPGAGATIGVGYAAKQPADGYTWLMAAPTPFYRTLVDPLPYTLESFTSLGIITSDPGVIFVNADSPYKTLDDLVKAARAKPEEISAGIVGLYGMQHLVYAFIAEQANIKWNYIPQPGGGPALAAVLGKHNDTSLGFAGVVGPHLEAGTLRALAIAADERKDVKPFKDIPTLKELGYDFKMSLWLPVLVRADTPAPIVEKSREFLRQIVEDKSFQKLMTRMGYVLEYQSGPDSMEFMRSDIAAMESLIQALKK